MNYEVAGYEDPAKARMELVGQLDPRALSSKEFQEAAFLFHASKNPNFRVEEGFDYLGEEVQGSTLGKGLYATQSREWAEKYAGIRAEGQGSVFSLLPYRAKMLSLVSLENPEKNRDIPKEIVEKWYSFAVIKVKERVEEYRADKTNPTKDFIADLMMEEYYKLPALLEKNSVDLRVDILNTGSGSDSVLQDIWAEFCAQGGIDGIIYVEGGEEDFRHQKEQTFVFYNLSTVGTYDDWQNRNKNEAIAADHEDANQIKFLQSQDKHMVGRQLEDVRDLLS